MKRREFLAAAIAAGSAAAVVAAEDPASSQNTSPIDRPDKAVKVGAGEARFGEEIKLFGSSPNDCKVSAKDTQGAMCIFESTVTRKGGPPSHIHPDQDEWFFILEGEFEIQVGDERFRLRAGDSVFAPRKVPHAWAAISDKPGKMIIVFQPAGKMEEFFRSLGEQTGLPTGPVIEKLFLDHGMKIVGPPFTID